MTNLFGLSPEEWTAVELSLRIAIVATAVALPFGIAIGWLLARTNFWGKTLLDGLVFLPLVGFDRSGVRLGTGGGFYDRAFAFRQLRSAWHAPRLVGLAYAFQELASIGAAAHDVLMDAVVTEEGFIRCSTG